MVFFENLSIQKRTTLTCSNDKDNKKKKEMYMTKYLKERCKKKEPL